MKFLRSLDRFFYKVEFGLLIAFLGSMVLLAFMQVVLRNFFGTGVIWADTFVRHLVLWSGFVGAALANMEAVNQLWLQNNRRPFEKQVADMIREMSKLTPRDMSMHRNYIQR